MLDVNVTCNLGTYTADRFIAAKWKCKNEVVHGVLQNQVSWCFNVYLLFDRSFSQAFSSHNELHRFYFHLENIRKISAKKVG